MLNDRGLRGERVLIRLILSHGVAGFWIENGEIAFPVHEITIAGNLKDLYRRISAIGNDQDVRGGIRCGSLLVDEMAIAGA